MTLVLSGAYRDAMGRFGCGDIADLDEHIEHQPRVEPGEPCICIVATEAPTRFKGFFSRLLQPWCGSDRRNRVRHLEDGMDHRRELWDRP